MASNKWLHLQLSIAGIKTVKISDICGHVYRPRSLWEDVSLATKLCCRRGRDGQAWDVGPCVETCVHTEGKPPSCYWTSSQRTQLQHLCQTGCSTPTMGIRMHKESFWVLLWGFHPPSSLAPSKQTSVGKQEYRLALSEDTWSGFPGNLSFIPWVRLPPGQHRASAEEGGQVSCVCAGVLLTSDYLGLGCFFRSDPRAQWGRFRHSSSSTCSSRLEWPSLKEANMDSPMEVWPPPWNSLLSFKAPCSLLYSTHHNT